LDPSYRQEKAKFEASRSQQTTNHKPETPPPLASTQGVKNTPAASTLGHCHVPGLPAA